MTWVTEFLHQASPLLVIGVVITVGVLFGGAVRRVGLPSMTGQIIAGIVMGRAGFDLFGDEVLRDLRPLTQVALGLIAVTVGAHLNFQRLRNAARRLSWLLLAETLITPLLVFVAILSVPGTSTTRRATSMERST